MKKYLISKVVKISFICSFLFLNNNAFGSNKLSNNNNLQNSKLILKNETPVSNKFEVNLFNSYILGPGDKIDLLFYGNPEYSKEYTILSDGTISLPFIESINIVGETLSSATELIEDKLSKEFISPSIFLTIAKSRPINVSIIGEVNKPGFYSLKENIKQLNTGNNTDLVPGLPTIIDAIKKAGGITKNTDLSNIELKRKLPKSFSKSHQIININLIRLLLNGDHKQNLLLLDGDIIKIGKTDNLNIKQFQLSRANLSPESIKIYVIGEVINPGVQNIDSQSTLNEAIYAAGGISPRRGKLIAELYRVNKDGSSTFREFKVNPKNGYSIAKNPQLLNGDIIKIKRNLPSVVGDTLQPVTEPITNILSIYRLLDLISD